MQISRQSRAMTELDEDRAHEDLMTHEPQCQDGRSAARQPHIVVIMADDLGAMDVGYAGSLVSTPVLDQLASEAVHASQFKTFPWCAPSRSAFQTGRNPYHLMGDYLKPADTKLTKKKISYFCPEERDNQLPRRMQLQGYTTALIGKDHSPESYFCKNETSGKEFDYIPKKNPGEMGWDHLASAMNGYSYSHWDHSSWVGPNGESLAHDVVEGGKEHNTDFIARKAIQVVSGLKADEKLFMWVAFTAPHTQEACKVEPDVLPFSAPDHLVSFYKAKLRKRGKVRDYYPSYLAMIDHMDTAIGRIVEAMKQKGMYENSLIVFLSDNGGPAIASYNGKLRGVKGLAYEGGVRTPFFMHWPSCLGSSARTTNHAIGMQDFYNTLLSLTPDADLSVNRESRALFGRFAGARGKVRFGEHYREDFENSKPHLDERATFLSLSRINSAVQQDGYKLVLSRQLEPKRAAIELFDLNSDPLELNNLLRKGSHRKFDHLLSELRSQINLEDFMTLPINPDFFTKQVDKYLPCDEEVRSKDKWFKMDFANANAIEGHNAEFFMLGRSQACKAGPSIMSSVEPLQYTNPSALAPAPASSSLTTTQTDAEIDDDDIVLLQH
jgi:arylsulfatase A-like enzyme